MSYYFGYTTNNLEAILSFRVYMFYLTFQAISHTPCMQPGAAQAPLPISGRARVKSGSSAASSQVHASHTEVGVVASVGSRV